MKKNSKRYKEILKNSIKGKKVEPKDAIELVKKNSTTKFDESIDVSLKINLKQSKGGDLSLRTVINLPNGSGKKNKVAVLCEADKIEESKKAGADVVGSDDLIEKIAAGKFDFTKLICTPAMMGKIGKYGKILGPKGFGIKEKTLNNADFRFKIQINKNIESLNISNTVSIVSHYISKKIND